MSSLDEIRAKNELALREFNSVKELKFPPLELPYFIKNFELDQKSPWKKSNLKFGDHILYQIVYRDYKTGKMMMTYPKMAIFTGYNIADQALEYEMVSPIRTWENNFKPKEGRFLPSTFVESHIEWDEIIYFFGIWKTKPNWKEMKIAYKHSFYFRNNRKSKIKRLLNSK